jgi:hypothetical protein
MQDNTVARLQSKRVLPSPPSVKCHVLLDSLSEQSKYALRNTKEKGVVGNLLYLWLYLTWSRAGFNDSKKRQVLFTVYCSTD